MVYFTINELCYSATAQANGINNTPNATQRNALTALVDTVLDPLRRSWGKPILVNSGYRCPRLNTLVKGARNSQHMLGQAADIRTESARQAIEMMHFIMDNCRFDQLILEHNAQGKRWVHVSYNAGKNRQQVLVIRA